MMKWVTRPGWLYLAAMLAGSHMSMALAASGVCERVVMTGNPDYPPLLWVNPDDSGRLMGAAVELLERVLESSDIHVDALNVGSREQAHEEVRTGRVDVLAGAFLIPGWLDEMDYVYPSFMEVPSVIFVRRGGAFPYSGWDDLRGKRGGSLTSSSFGSAFDMYATDHLTITRFSSIDEAFERLLSGELDYLIHERHQGVALAAQRNLQNEIDMLDGSLINEQLYYAVSHHSACNSSVLRAALAKGMYQMVGQGEARRILEKYRALWSAQFAPATAPEQDSVLE